jgi:hypothetical protein
MRITAHLLQKVIPSVCVAIQIVFPSSSFPAPGQDAGGSQLPLSGLNLCGLAVH